MKHTAEVTLDPMIVRLLDFIKRKGGASEVARQIGLNQPAVFNNYKSGRNRHPAPEILQKIAVTYADFDPLYILTGRASLPTNLVKLLPAPADNSLPTDIGDQMKDQQIESLKQQLALQKDTINILRAIVGAQLGKDLEVKTESASNLTQGMFSFVKPVAAGRLITPMLRDARGINQVYPNQASKYPKY